METTTTQATQLDDVFADLLFFTTQAGMRGGTYTDAHIDPNCPYAKAGTPAPDATTADCWPCSCIPVDVIPAPQVGQEPVSNFTPGPHPARQHTHTPDEGPIDPAQVEAWLRGLGRKVELADVTPRVIVAATTWARTWEGTFAFMVEMRTAASKARGLTAGQAKGVMNCWRADLLCAPQAPAAPAPAETSGQPAAAPQATAQAPQAPAQPQQRTNRYPGKCPNCHRWVEAGEGVLERVDSKWVTYHREGECPVSEFVATDGTKVPEGRYAFADEDGTVHFVQLVDGVVYAQGSDDLHAIRGGGQAQVDRVATDIEGCARLYGREIGACCRCGRTLTSEWRQQGIGPVCAKKAGW